MNTPAPFPAPSSALKLTRRVPAENPSPAAPETATADRHAQNQLAAELEAFREREANLRAYEERLRAWQDQLDAQVARPAMTASGSPFPPRPGSVSPFTDFTLEEAWEKFHRARALLEAEQNQVRDDRMTFREAEMALKRREAELTAREARVAAREQALAAGEVESTAEPEEKKISAVQRFTQAPFLAVFKPGR